MFRVCHAYLSVHCSPVVTCSERASLLACMYVKFCCVFVTFPCGTLGQVWYLIVSIPNLCLLTYFHSATQSVQSALADDARVGVRQYIEKGKEKKVYCYGECCNQGNIVSQNSCYVARLELELTNNFKQGYSVKNPGEKHVMLLDMYTAIVL